MRTAWFRLIAITAAVSACEARSAPEPEASPKAASIHTTEHVGSSSEDERTVQEIDALVAAGQLGEAHTRARLFVQSHPDGPFTPHVVALMGVHPHREGPQRGPVDEVKP